MTPLVEAMIHALAQHGEVRAVDVSAPSDQAFATAALQLREIGITTLALNPTTLLAQSAFELLDAERIRADLNDAIVLSDLDIRIATGSTNADALGGDAPAVGSCAVRLAEYQTDGQGRRGAKWRSPFATGLCLTLATRINTSRNVSTLPLACGVAVRRALAALGVESVQLKWPNDLIVNEGKLGGLLMQMRQIPNEPALLIIGLGLNVMAVPEAVDAAALKPVSVKDCIAAPMPTRNRVAASMIGALWAAATTFERSGFAAFNDDWQHADFLRDRAVHVHDDTGVRTGVARGVNEHGELMVEIDQHLVSVNAGNVSVRPQP